MRVSELTDLTLHSRLREINHAIDTLTSCREKLEEILKEAPGRESRRVLMEQPRKKKRKTS